MTIREAFRNRGLLVPEMQEPVYRVTYGRSRYEKKTVEFQTNDRRMAENELQRKWKKYVETHCIPENTVLEIHCIESRGWKRAE